MLLSSSIPRAYNSHIDLIQCNGSHTHISISAIGVVNLLTLPLLWFSLGSSKSEKVGEIWILRCFDIMTI